MIKGLMRFIKFIGLMIAVFLVVGVIANVIDPPEEVEKPEQQIEETTKIEPVKAEKQYKNGYEIPSYENYTKEGFEPTNVYIEGTVYDVFEDRLVIENGGCYWFIMKTSGSDIDLSGYKDKKCEVYGSAEEFSSEYKGPVISLLGSNNHHIKFFDGKIYNECDTTTYEAFKKEEQPNTEQQKLEPSVGSENLPNKDLPASKEDGNASTGNNRNETATVTVPKEEETVGNLVWIPTNGGTKYHSRAGCSNMNNPIQVSVETAEARGFTPCRRCH